MKNENIETDNTNLAKILSPDFLKIEELKWTNSKELEFLLNAKVLLKNLQTIRTTIKNKITESDTLSYVNLTDMLIQKANKK